MSCPCLAVKVVGNMKLLTFVVLDAQMRLLGTGGAAVQLNHPVGPWTGNRTRILCSNPIIQHECEGDKFQLSN